MGLIARQALLMAAKDTRVFFKDKFAVGFAFLFPFLFVIGFSFALGDFGPGDEPLELAIATQETETFSMTRVIIQVLTQGGQTLDQSPTGGMRIVAMDYQDALAAVEDESLDGFVSFPPDFSERFSQPSPTALEVVTSGSADPDTRAALRGLATGIAASLSEVGVIGGVVSELEVKFSQVDWESVEIYMIQPFDPSVTLEIETVGEVEPVGASNFTLPAYLTMFVFFAAALSAEAIARERQGQTLERLLSNGARRESIILGKFVGIAFRGLLQLAVLWAAGILIFGIDLGLSPVAVVLVSVLMALTSAAFGVMLASFVVDIRAASTAGVLVSLTLAPIGGCWWPLFITPEWMQSLAKLTPHGWANGAFNKLMLFGAEFGDVTQEMIAIPAFGIAFLAIALWRFRLSAT